jgi:amino acid permease
MTTNETMRNRYNYNNHNTMLPQLSDTNTTMTTGSTRTAAATRITRKAFQFVILMQVATLSHAFDGVKVSSPSLSSIPTTITTTNSILAIPRISSSKSSSSTNTGNSKNTRYNAQWVDDTEAHTDRSAPWIFASSTSRTTGSIWDSLRNTIPTSTSSTLPGNRQRQPHQRTPSTLFPFPFTSSTTAVPSSELTGSKKSSMVEMIVSLVKAIVGGGVLAIPAAVTTLGDSPQQVLPTAVALIIVMGTINAYYFSIMGKVCDWTNATTFSQAWERTMGNETSSLFASIICIKTALSCIAYSMIIAESFQSMAISAGFLDTTLTEALLAVTGVALLPLCLMKDLSSLAPFSLAGILGFAYTGGAMSLRAFDGSYHLAPIDTVESGKYLIDLQDPYKPSFGHTGPELQGLVLACTLATAFVSHYNAPRFHNELETKEEFDTVTYTSFGISAALMAVIAVAGFTTFGIASAPVILNNYSPYDPLIAAGRTAIAASLVATFPFPFFGLRDSIWDAMNVPIEQRNTPNRNINNVLVTIGLLTMITGIALSVNDLSLLMSLGGGTIATAVYSVFPTVMFRAAVNNQQQLLSKEDESKSFTGKHQFDINLSTGLMGLCIMTGATGVGLALQNHFVH